MTQVLKIVCLSLLCVLLVGVLMYFWNDLFPAGEDRPELDMWRYRLADGATGELAEELPRFDDVYRVVMLPVARDATRDQPVTHMLRERIAESSKYSLVDEADFEGFVEQHWGGHAPEGPAQVAEIFGKKPELQNELKVDGVLIPELEIFDRGADGLGAEIRLGATLLVLERAEPVKVGPVGDRIDGRFSLAYLAGWMNERSVFWRAVLFLIVLLGLPFATYPLAWAVMRKENNLHNALLVLGYAGFTAFFALFLTGFYLTSFATALAVVLGGVGAVVYNFLALDFLEEQR